MTLAYVYAMLDFKQNKDTLFLIKCQGDNLLDFNNTRNLEYYSNLDANSDWKDIETNPQGLNLTEISKERFKRKKRITKFKEVLKREAHLKRTYGINLLDYYTMLQKQNGGCAMCGRKNSSERRLAIDHCHVTGKVRGLLCIGCNTALGQYEMIKEKAEKYLKEHK